MCVYLTSYAIRPFLGLVVVVLRQCKIVKRTRQPREKKNKQALKKQIAFAFVWNG
jgi:hypothetical protein